MVGSGVGKIVDVIHLSLGQGLLRRILHHKEVLSVGLHQPLGGEGIGVLALDAEALGILSAVGHDLLIGGQHDLLHGAVGFLAGKHRAVDPGDVLGFHAAIERVGNLHHRPLSHAVHQKVCLRIEENGALALARQ